MECFDISRMNLFKEDEIEHVLKCSQISAFQHDLEKIAFWNLKTSHRLNPSVLSALVNTVI